MKHHFGTWSVLFTVHLYSWDHRSQSVQFPTFAYQQLNQFFSQSYMHRPNSAFNTLGGEVYYTDFFCSVIFLLLQNHPLVTFWISPSQQVLPQLSCGDAKKECDSKNQTYFWKIENFPDGEINNCSFSNPHPWSQTKWLPLCMNEGIMTWQL